MKVYLEIESEVGTDFEADVIVYTLSASELVSIRNAAGMDVMHKLSADECKAVIAQAEEEQADSDRRNERNIEGRPNALPSARNRPPARCHQHAAPQRPEWSGFLYAGK